MTVEFFTTIDDCERGEVEVGVLADVDIEPADKSVGYFEPYCSGVIIRSVKDIDGREITGHTEVLEERAKEEAWELWSEEQHERRDRV